MCSAENISECQIEDQLIAKYQATNFLIHPHVHLNIHMQDFDINCFIVILQNFVYIDHNVREHFTNIYQTSFCECTHDITP